ncbi:MAG: TldD/PmbA family protein [Candidatus Korarchaeum sp.]|nr:TldD/PmbA family protein [Candidatus Korarchaeum sp.]MDW8035852.1 TldD/PmbA family protein [Candidatus Korarchaeum sp.]
MELEVAISKGIELGADFVEIREERSRSTILRVVDGVIRELSSGDEFRIGVRTLYKGGWGFSVVRSAGDLEVALRDSLKLAKLSSNPSLGFEADWPSFKGSYEVLGREPAYEVPIDRKVGILIDQYEIASSMKSVRNTNIYLLDSLKEDRIVNSQGTDVSQKMSRVRIAAYIFAHESGVTEAAFESKGGLGGIEVVEGSDVAERAAKRAVEALSAVPAPPGPHKAILDPKLAGVFIHEAFGHAAEGDSVVNGESILTDMIGKPVGPSSISVVDDPTLGDLYGSYKYDDEGTEARRKYIVKDGILSSYLTNLEVSKRLNVEPTGNARSMDFSNPPEVRMSNTFIEKGDWSFEEMLSDIREGIYAFGSLYGYTDPAKGQFMFKAEGGWLIERGEMTRRLREVAITGMTLEVLHNVDAVSKDLQHDPGSCGKKGQWVPVTTGSPHLMIRSLVFGGR